VEAQKRKPNAGGLALRMPVQNQKELLHAPVTKVTFLTSSPESKLGFRASLCASA